MQTNNWRLKKAVAFGIAVLITLVKVSAEDYEARYWFDLDTANVRTCTVSAGQKTLSVPVGQLPVKPINTINFQIRNAAGDWSAVYTSFFFGGRNKEMKLSYSFDNSETSYGLDMTDPHADVSRLNDGLHRIMVYDSRCNTVPVNSMFVKKSYAGKNMTLLLQSPRDSVRISVPLADGMELSEEVDVSELQPGIYPFKAILVDKESKQVLAMTEPFVNVLSKGGNRVTGVYYWLNDSVSHSKFVPVADGNMPLRFDMDLDVSDLNEPTSDWSMEIRDGAPMVTPNFNISVGVMSNLGFRADSVSYIRDNSKTERLRAVDLKSGEQYDFGKVPHDTVLWAQFPVRPDDEIRFLPRWRSSGKFFDQDGTAVDTVKFDERKKDVRFKTEVAGMRYVQLYGIDESIRDYSVLMTYVSGPSFEENGGSAANEFEGIPVDWKTSNEWTTAGDDLLLTKNGIGVEVLKSTSDSRPSVNGKSNICRILKDNRLVIEADAYIEQITLCAAKGYPIPELKASEGVAEIEHEKNIIVWKGLSKKVDFAVGKNSTTQSDTPELAHELLFEKAYVKLSEIDESMLTIDAVEELPEDFEYMTFNCLRIWDNGEKAGEYRIDDHTSLTFRDNTIVVSCDGKENAHEVRDRIILTYSHEDTPSQVGSIDDAEPSVAIKDTQIVISGLPAFVGIYTVDGRTVYSAYVNDETFTYPLDGVVPGIYIIKVGDSVTKMLIR